MDILQSASVYQDDYNTPPPTGERMGSFPPSTMSTHTAETRSPTRSIPPSYAPEPASETTVASDTEAPKDRSRDINTNGQGRHDLSVGRAKEEDIADDGLHEKPPVPAKDSAGTTSIADDDIIMPPTESEANLLTEDPTKEDLPVGDARAEATEGGLGILGGGMRRMVDLVNRLRASGIEDLGLPLPRIAVVGNQSAGKSSLIEAISGIKVPRYTGTCTRCPLEINLSESSDPTDAWHCRISLRFKKRYDPSLATTQKSRNPNRICSPWVDQATEQVAFVDITDKDQVERVLVAAQKAVLNPSRNWRDFAHELGPDPSQPHQGVSGRVTWQGQRRGGGSSGAWAGFGKKDTQKKQVVDAKRNVEEDFEVKFSPNVVCMEITGPDLPNLAFIDLPGVIQTTESENEHYLIDLVTGLVKEYVQEEDCLIMLAMTMKDDAVNQSAARLARELGEERTIGALTKPDTVGPGEYEQWINILRGNSHRLKHGYFVTKQPNQEQLVRGIDHAEARAQETAFFENTEPWKTELRDLKYRFGTQALQSYLAKELGELIKKRLPGIIGSIRKQHAEVKEELAALPPPPTDNQTFIVHDLIREFDTLLGGHLIGGPGHNEFQQELRRVAEQFQRALKSVRPALKMFETLGEEEGFAALLASPRKMAGRANKRAGEGGEWFGDREREASPSLRKAKKGKQGVEVHTLSSDEGNVAGLQPKKRRGANELITASSSKKSKRTTNVVLGTEIEDHRFNLPQIRHIIESTATARIPGQVDPTAIANLIKHSINLWNPIVHNFLNSCGTLLNHQVHDCFTRVFEGYKRSPIFEAIYNILNRLVHESFEHQKGVVERLWWLESEQISTLNDEDYNKYIESHLGILAGRRARNLEDQAGNTVSAPDGGPNEDNNNVTPSRKRKTLQPPQTRENQPDPYRKEVEVLAQVRAYNEVAQKRFVDNVYMSIQGELVNGFRKSILATLQNGLRLNGPDVAEICTDLLVEDPQKEKRRKELLGKSEQLARAMEELSRL